MTLMYSVSTEYWVIGSSTRLDVDDVSAETVTLVAAAVVKDLLEVGATDKLVAAVVFVSLVII